MADESGDCRDAAGTTDPDDSRAVPAVGGGDRDWPRVAVAVALAVGLAVGGLLVGVVVVQVAALVLVALAVELSDVARVVLSAILLQGVAFGSVALAYLALRDLGVGYVGIGVPDLRGAIWVASGYVLSLLGVLAIGLLAVLAELDPASNRLAELGEGNPELFLLLIPLSFLLIGPGEELLFRGLVQGTLRETLGPVPAIGLASVVFAAAHIPSLTGGLGSRLVTVGLLVVPALVLGVAYERTDNVVVPALIHGAYNATLFGLAYVSMTYDGADAAALTGAVAAFALTLL